MSVYTAKIDNISGISCYGDTSYLKVTIPSCEIWIPNSFTPNNDGINDLFLIKGGLTEKIEYLTIYNRWGDLVLQSNKNIPWDGKNSPNGLYTISIFLNENRIIKTIKLIR